MDPTKVAYEKAIEVLHKCATANGFFAAYPGYDAVWARDSMIASLGASLVKNNLFKNAYRHSLIALAKHQSDLGQIPNAVDIFSRRKPHVDFQSIDSTLWYIIGHYVYRERYRDNSLFKTYRDSIQKALTWIRYQDTGEDLMPAQLPTTDWQDAFPHKYGHTINTQALYYKVLMLAGETKKAQALKRVVNKLNGFKLWNGKFYLPWRWKNHNKYHEKGNWFDSLGNLLAVVFGLADDYQAKSILSHIKQKRINEPYPVKAIYPPIRHKSKEWHDYFNDCDARTPYNYLNGGIWPFIGGFYIIALIKYKKLKDAQQQIAKLAEANMKSNGNFSEWLHGKTGKPSAGGNQAWNAGMYILAYHSLKKKRCLI